MADPSGYAPGYSFSGFQASSPAKPLPGPSLDGELAAIAASLASVIAALADVRRSDGALPNGEVTLDALDAAVRAAIAGEREGLLVTDLDPAAFATAAQAAAGTANDKIMTPLNVKQALAGQRAFASQAAAQAGVEAGTVLSPFLGKAQLDALRGFATQAEAEGFIDDTKVMTPLRVKQLVDKSHKVLGVSQALTWGEIAAGASQTQTVIVTGAAAGDAVAVGFPGGGIEAGLFLVAWTSAVHTVSLRLHNLTAVPIDPADATWKIKVFRF